MAELVIVSVKLEERSKIEVARGLPDLPVLGAAAGQTLRARGPSRLPAPVPAAALEPRGPSGWTLRTYRPAGQDADEEGRGRRRRHDPGAPAARPLPYSGAGHVDGLADSDPARVRHPAAAQTPQERGQGVELLPRPTLVRRRGVAAYNLPRPWHVKGSVQRTDAFQAHPSHQTPRSSRGPAAPGMAGIRHCC